MQARYAVKGGRFDESEHVRDGHGRFSRKPGGALPRRGAAGDAPTPKPPGARATVGELIPTVGKGSVTPKQLADLHRQLRTVVEGEFVGFRTQLTGLDLDRDFLTLAVTVTRDGVNAGEVERNFHREDGGVLAVEHAFFNLAEPYRRQGFASAFNSHMEQWYRESGVERIFLQTAAGLEAGGYAWAAAGYDWDGSLGESLSGAPKVIDRLRDKLDDLDNNVVELQDTLDALPDDYRHRDRLQQRLDRLQAASDEAGELLARADHYEFGEPGYPTPFEISQLGRAPGQRDSGDPDEWWLGKRVMAGSQWSAVKRLDGDAQAGGKAAKAAGDRAAMLRDMAAVHDEWVAEHAGKDPAAADDPGAHEQFVQRVQAVLERHRGEGNE